MDGELIDHQRSDQYKYRGASRFFFMDEEVSAPLRNNLKAKIQTALIPDTEHRAPFQHGF
jgi:hypothetical protein